MFVGNHWATGGLWVNPTSVKEGIISNPLNQPRVQFIEEETMFVIVVVVVIILILIQIVSLSLENGGITWTSPKDSREGKKHMNTQNQRRTLQLLGQLSRNISCPFGFSVVPLLLLKKLVLEISGPKPYLKIVETNRRLCNTVFICKL